MSGKAEVMILCAGNGTRLGDLTIDTPKVMLPVAGKPALQWTIESLARQGIQRVVINLCRLADMVTYHFGDGSRFGLEIRYSLEETLLGTAGGIKRALPMLADTFWLVLGDVLSTLEWSTLTKAGDVMLAADAHPRPWEGGCLMLNGDHQITAIQEKPPRDGKMSRLVFAGRARLSKSVVNDFPPHATDLMGEALPAILSKWDMRATFLCDVLTQDIGTPEGYQRAQELWRVA